MRIGVDLGGTKIEVVAIADEGSQLFRHRLPTPAGDYEGTLATIESLVGEVESRYGRGASVGVGTPGAIDPATGLLRHSNSVVLNGKPLERDIGQRLGRAIQMANDANCLALSEAIDGSGAGRHVVFAAILGTGVGGGIAVDRHVLQGRNNIAGEWGHNHLPWSAGDEVPGPLCYCGKRGCLETFLSGPAFAASFKTATGRTMTPAEIAAAAQSGDGEASSALSAYEDRLARGLAAVVNIIDPDAIVLGGGLSKISRLYENVPLLIATYTISPQIQVELLPALHGDSSGVRGAAWL